MRKMCVAGLLLVTLVGCGAVEYMPPEGDFRITMPAAPVADTDAQGPLYRLTDDEINYVIRRMAIAEGEAAVGDERLFDGFQSAAVAGLQGRLVARRSVTSGGAAHVGREFTVDGENKVSGGPYSMIWRVFHEGANLYVLQATTARGAEPRVRAVKVLDTFALLK